MSAEPDICSHGHDRNVVGRYVDPQGRSHGCLACHRRNGNVTHPRTPTRRLVWRRYQRKRANARDLERLEQLLDR